MESDVPTRQARVLAFVARDAQTVVARVRRCSLAARNGIGSSDAPVVDTDVRCLTGAPRR